MGFNKFIVKGWNTRGIYNFVMQIADSIYVDDSDWKEMSASIYTL